MLKSWHIDQYLSEKSQQVTDEDVVRAHGFALLLEASLAIYLRSSPYVNVVEYMVGDYRIYVERVAPERPLTYVITFPWSLEGRERPMRVFLSLWGTPIGWSVNGRQLLLNFLRHVSEEDAIRWFYHALSRLSEVASRRVGE